MPQRRSDDLFKGCVALLGDCLIDGRRRRMALPSERDERVLRLDVSCHTFHSHVGALYRDRARATADRDAALVMGDVAARAHEREVRCLVPAAVLLVA